MIHFNTSENSKQRQKVKPLTLEEMEKSVKFINILLEHSNLENDVDLLQRFIDDYQNKTHFFDVAGGWEGLNANEWVDVNERLPEEEGEYIASVFLNEEKGNIVTAFDYKKKTGWNFSMGIAGFSTSSITHWMPFPAPPL